MVMFLEDYAVGRAGDGVVVGEFRVGSVFGFFYGTFMSVLCLRGLRKLVFK